ncbi:MAG: hypothetical protein CHACPFDD_03997 [Phycisphaerae bacterium]|nr:hypothetical protein [Phycisphaerae bacterium]
MRYANIVSVAWLGGLGGLALIWLGPAAVAQVPPGYEIVQLTENSWQEDPPKINNHDQIVFARRSGPNGTGEIILYDRATDNFTQLTNDAINDILPDINDDGVIVWSSEFGPPDQYGPTGEIMLRWPDGTIEQLTDDGRHDRGPRINAVSRVAWFAYNRLRMGDHRCVLTMLPAKRSVVIACIVCAVASADEPAAVNALQREPRS